MQTEFARVLTLLRKEKGISQKAAASDLGISQALLSHYEKGVRECGLEFIVKTADYYGVSCDYLLGRSAERSGVILGSDDLPEPEDGDKALRSRGSLLPAMNKKLIANSVNVVYGLLSRIGSRELTVAASEYLAAAVYTVYRSIYSANAKNPQDAFLISKDMWRELTLAAQMTDAMSLRCITSGIRLEGVSPLGDLSDMELSSEKLSRDYPLFASSLANLIKNTEENISKKNGKSRKA